MLNSALSGIDRRYSAFGSIIVQIFSKAGLSYAALALVCAASSAHAQDRDGRAVSVSEDLDILFRTDARLRYETADSDGFAQNGEALTLRIRPSIEINPRPMISVLAEAEAIISVLPNRLNGFVSASPRPGISDEEVLELNRLQIEFAPTDNLSLTAGRQRISLDDERFIGTVDFRQNQQTYDAVTTAFQAPAGITLRAGYIWRVGRILGPEQPNGVFDSDSFYINAAVALPIGQVTLYHYDLDLDDRVATQILSKTSGVVVRGRTFSGHLGLFWEAGYARQSSMGASPEFVRASLSANLSDFTLAAKFEELGSDDGTAFQTPLATLHKFQGPADIFLVTPPDGIRDFEGRASWRIGSIGPARASLISLQYNRYEAANGIGKYGDEWSAQIATTVVSTRFSIEAAHYNADGFAEDTTRFWLTASRQF